MDVEGRVIVSDFGVARALEVIRSTGKPIAEWQQARQGGIGDEIDLRAEDDALVAAMHSRAERLSIVAAERVRDTRGIGVLITDAEELGLAGARAWARERRGLFRIRTFGCFLILLV